MALANRQKDTPVPPELQPYYDGNKGVGWLRWLIRIAIPLSIIIVLALGIIWLAHRDNSSKSTGNKSTGSSQTKQQATPKSSSNSSPSSSGSSTSGSAGSSASGVTATPDGDSASSTTQSATIPNTGPGDTVALFIAASFTGALAYQVVVRRKLANE